MPQVPEYQRRQGIPTQANAVRGNPGASSMGVPQIGEAIGSALDGFAEAERRVQDRNDTINRVRDINAFNAEVEQDLRGFETGADLSSPAAVQSFGETVKKKMDKYIAEHGGSEDSKAKLFERLDGVRSSYATKVAQASSQAQRKLLNATIGEGVNSIVSRVSQNPGSVPEMFESLDGLLKDVAPALTAEDEQTNRAAGRSAIIKTAATSLIERGAYGEARNLLAEGSEAVKYLSPDDQRTLTSSIVRAEVAAEKAEKAGEMKVREAEQILGRKLNPMQRQKLAGVAPAEGKETPSQKIAGIEQALGRRLTPAEVEKALGVSEGGEFGAGITGRALSIITDDAPAFAAGLLNEAEERRFMSAVTQYTQPSAMPNPDTGLIETRSPTLPSFAAEALQRRGMAIPTPRGPGAAPGTPSPSPGLPGSGSDRTQAPDAMGGKTIFQMAGDIAGPIPAIGEALSRTPGVGEFVQAPQMTQARNFVGLISRDLVRVMQNNPRYAEGERAAIEKDASIDAATFDTPQAFRNRLIAIDDSLSIREQNAFKTATSSTVGRDERVQALNVLNGIVNFRASLGVPPRVKTPEEAKKLPPGSMFIDPQGNIRQVPQ